MSSPYSGHHVSSERFQIIALNNQGASALSCGCMSVALSSFCQALQKSKACMLSQQKDDFDQQEMRPSSRFDIDHLMEASCFGLHCDGESDESCPGHDSSNNSAISSSFPAPSVYPSRQGLNNDDKLNSNSGFIYGKPICIPSSYADNTEFRHSDVLLSSIVIFNLALTHHISAIMQYHEVQQQTQTPQGIVAFKRRLSILKKAAKLYELAIQLQEEHAAIDGPESCSKLFFLSCINNLGNTFRLLGDLPSSDKIYQHLLTMLIYLNYNEEQQGYNLSIANNSVASDASPEAATETSSTTTTTATTMAVFSAGRTYVSFFRNIFESDIKSAPAA